MKKIAFWANQFSLRGTEIAIYDYAKHNEELLKNKSVIFGNPLGSMDSLKKFQERFEVNIMHWVDVESYLLKNNFDFLFVIGSGRNSGYSSDLIKTLVQAVFRYNEPHGYKYFYNSEWLAKDQGYNSEEYSLPHICEPLPVSKYDFRKKHGIPKTATVFGCYGGSTEFNINFVHKAILNTVEKNKNIYFIFMNINKFAEHPQIIFSQGTYDTLEKSAFVESCNAMIHARYSGETFGMAVAEFSMSNKPVITYSLSSEKTHLDILKEKAILYENYEDVVEIFNNLSNYIKFNDYYKPYEQFSAPKIMEKFKKLLQ